MELKRGVNTVQFGDEVTFPIVGGFFGGVGGVYVWWRKLVV